MSKVSCTLPPPPHARRNARFLKLLPIAALLAAPQVWATNCDETLMSGYCIGTNGGSKNNVIVDTVLSHLIGVVGGASASGPATNLPDTSGIANYNTLTIESAGEVVEAIGGWGFNTASPQANGNKLIVRGTVTGSATGGFSDRGAATGNEVFIDGGTVTTEVVGGQCGTDNCDATGNTVTLAGATVKGHVKGGKSGGDSVAGNTLAVQGTGSTVDGYVTDFAALAFILPANIKSGDTMLTGYAVQLPAPYETAPTKVSISGSPALKVGESITLINATNILSITPDTQTVTTAEGLVFEVKKDGSKLIATVQGSTTPGSTSTLSAAFSGGVNNSAGSMPTVQVNAAGTAEVEITLQGAGAGEREVRVVIENAKSQAFEKATFVGGGDSEMVTFLDGKATLKIEAVPGETVTFALYDPACSTPDIPFSKLSLKVEGASTGGGGGSSPTLGELGLLLSGLALAGAAAPALRRRERKARKQD